MNAGLAIRSVLTLLATACVIYLLFFVEPGRFPLDFRPVDAHTLAIEPRPGSALPPGFQPDDRVDLRDQDLRTRVALYMETLPGESYVLDVQRSGATVAVPITKFADQQTIPGGGLQRALLLLVLVLGLTTLWWGRDWSAWGLSVFAIAIILNIFLFVLPLPPIAALVATLLNQSVVVLGLAPALYVSTLAMAGPALRGSLRRGLHVAFGVALAAAIAVVTAQTVASIVFGNLVLQRTGVAGLLFALTLVVPLIVLVAALPRADSGRRLRLRWILSSLALFLGAIVWGNLGEFGEIFSTRGLVRQAIWWTALLCGIAGLLYAVLRKRVVAMSFAVNRALVYGVVAALVIGVFGALTVVLENTAIGSEAGLALTVGISLAIGFVLEALRDRINLVVERLFFRRRYEAEAALRRFARECAYIERADRLLEEAEAEIHRHVRPASSAFYEALDDAYVCVRQRGEPAHPERIDVDDRAFVAMRADREPVELHDVTSALGSEGFAFPMAVRGVLGGALVIGPRTEAYTRDERRLIAELAQQVGTALHALRARDNEALVRALASGELDLSTARRHARLAGYAGR